MTKAAKSSWSEPETAGIEPPEGIAVVGFDQIENGGSVKREMPRLPILAEAAPFYLTARSGVIT